MNHKFFHWLYYQRKKHFVFNISIGFTTWLYIGLDLPFGTSDSDITNYFILIFILFPFALLWPLISYSIDFLIKKMLITKISSPISFKILLFKLFIYTNFLVIIQGVFCFWECININTYLKLWLDNLLILSLIYIPFLLYGKYFFTNKLVGNETEDLFKLQGDGKNVLKLRLDNIICFNSDDNYVDITVIDKNGKHKTIVFRATLTSISKQLKGQSHFIRVHRSFVINLKYLSDFNKKDSLKINHKDLELTIPVSKKHLKDLLELTK